MLRWDQAVPLHLGLTHGGHVIREGVIHPETVGCKYYSAVINTVQHYILLYMLV